MLTLTGTSDVPDTLQPNGRRWPRELGDARQSHSRTLTSITRGAAAFGLLLVFATGAHADTFKIASGACYGVVCEAPSPAAVCIKYAEGRIRYSQNNPADSNKWVSYSAMVAPPPVVPSPLACASIGLCTFNLHAQAGGSYPQSIGVSQCGVVIEQDDTQDGFPSEDPSGSNSCRSGNPSYGNPIYPARGTKRESVDLGLGLGPLSLGLTYDTSGKLPATTAVQGAPADPLPSAFGPLWLSSFHRRLTVDSDLTLARVARGNGQIVGFVGDGAGQFTAPAHTGDRLVKVTGGYRYYAMAQQAIESYDAEGLLSRIDYASGRSLFFTYSGTTTPLAVAWAPGYLLKVEDNFGRSIRFEYESVGLVKNIVDQTGRSTLPFFTSGNLTRIRWPDLAELRFVYEKPALPWALTGIVDERNIRKSRYDYDSAGRATLTEGAGAVNRFSVAYSTPPAVVVTDTFDAGANVTRRVRSWQAPVGTAVTTPLAGTVDLSVSLFGTQPRVTSRSQPAGSGCAASTSAMTFDANGNAESADDFNGSRTCFVNDPARNLETMRVEGLATGADCAAATVPGATLPPKARRVSTEWHPDWKLRGRTAEPGRLTTYVYNGQPDPLNGGTAASCAPASALLPDGKPIAVLCHKIEQATLDPTGSQGFSASLDPAVEARTESWTYNQLGQVLTADGPRTDVADVQVYEYYEDTSYSGADPNAVGHSVGDLKQVTNAAGKVTQYTKYNKAGQLLESRDGNNVVTSYVYDARQRQTSVAVGGQATQYSYWPTGQVKRVTQPDGVSFVEYKYDDAQRLFEVRDHLNNTITYTLDNAGKRTEEKVRDPGGALRRQLSRVIDALGRVERVTGRE